MGSRAGWLVVVVNPMVASCSEGVLPGNIDRQTPVSMAVVWVCEIIGARSTSPEIYAHAHHEFWWDEFLWLFRSRVVAD